MPTKKKCEGCGKEFSFTDEDKPHGNHLKSSLKCKKYYDDCDGNLTQNKQSEKSKKENFLEMRHYITNPARFWQLQKHEIDNAPSLCFNPPKLCFLRGPTVRFSKGALGLPWEIFQRGIFLFIHDDKRDSTWYVSYVTKSSLI